MSTLPLERLSLFAVDVDDGDETYLVWGRAAEPKLLEFIGATERTYQDFAAYLAAHLGETVRLRGDTTPPAADETLAAHLANERARLDLWIGGFERWGQPVVARAAIAAARLVLPTLPAASRKKVEPLLQTAAEWAQHGRGELPVPFAYTLNAARPVSPAFDGKQVFEAMHACLAAAGSATSYHLERPIVVDADEVKAALLTMRTQPPADLARALCAAGLTTPSGAAWKPATAAKARDRLEKTLEHARDNACAAVEHVVAALGKGVEPKIRRAVRQAFEAKPRKPRP
ncbi:MAG: hypothetical protein JNL79_10385 [Myxococcales bacterium]|nr:hypothetical protein [Myxococcales bacterium]